MKTQNRQRCAMAVFLAGLALLFLSGCGQGLPDAEKNSAKAVEKELKTAGKFIKDQQAKFDSMSGSEAFKPIAGYAQKENWAAAFDRAGSDLKRAQGLYDTDLAPIMKKNDPQDAVKARIQINRINKVIQEARDQTKAPFSRMDRIRTAMTQTQSVYVRAGNSGRTVMEKIQALDTGPVAEAREKFPDALSKIDARFSPFSKMEKQTQAHLTVLEKEYQAFGASKPVDYAAFITSADAMDASLKEMDTLAPELEKDIAQLYLSYTKVLQDMKEDYYVTVKRESWDERSDSYNPGFTTFQRKVSPAVFQTLAETELESIADITPAYGRLNLKKHIGSTWDALEINPTENWPSRRQNAATFWIENTKPVYFHKYIQETNGETKETDWVKVNPSFYEQNLDNLGMAVLSKPYGEFEPDTQAAPPGMAYVGNSQYGEWKKDENGESFWSWYGRYAFFSSLFFFPPSYYHYGSWNRWNKNYRYKKPYYGKTKSGAYTYGTRGTKIKRSPRYQNTNFAKTGGFKSRPASVRGGGSSLRGGGPKGKGK